MKHGRDCPDRCSMCRADVVVRRVTHGNGGELLIDGRPAGRGLDQLTPMEAHAYAKRGGLKHGRRRQG